jgi:regulator of sirC expression with transglutaminase-like and TPR domain
MPQAMHPDGGTLPSPSTIQAAVSLLGDPLPNVVRLCSAQILAWGAAASDALAEAAEHADPRLRVRARALLRTLRLREWVDRVADLAARLRCERASSLAGSALLEEGVLLLSAVGRPLAMLRDDIAAHLERLGNAVARATAGRSSISAARQLGETLADREDMRGARGPRYEPGDVGLDRLLERRRGTPATLALLYLLVGRRAGLRLSRVVMPDHALLRVHGSRPVLIDPFHGGRTVTRADCLRYLRTVGHRHAAGELLRDMSDREVLCDFVASLRQVAGYNEDRGLCRAIERAGELLASDH